MDSQTEKQPSLFKRTLQKIRRPTTEAISKSETQEFIKAQAFIDLGISKIVEGKYEEATGYFQNKQVAQEVGLTLQPEETKIIGIDHNLKPEEYKKYQNALALGSHADPNFGIIKIASFFPVAFINGKQTEFTIPQELHHETALVSAEEWLHGLQFLNKNKPLNESKDSRITKAVENGEVDVAFYLHQKGVPMTEAFLDRYGRREAITTLLPSTPQ